MADRRPTLAQRAALIDARSSVLHGGLSEAGGVWVPDHPDLLHEHSCADIDALADAGLLDISGQAPTRWAVITADGMAEADMMSDLDRLRAAVELLGRATTGERLGVLQRLVTVNGGRWDLPHEGGRRPYNPIMVSAHLFGVTAFADAPDELAMNWLRAATNLIRAADEQEAVA